MSADENPDVMETISSIVSRTGGFASGNPGDYCPGNSLYLCPRHQRLMKRGLIRVPDLKEIFEFEKNPKKEIERIDQISSYFDELKTLVDTDQSNIRCMIYESRDGSEFVWSEQNRIAFKKRHFNNLLDWLRKFLVTRLGEDT